MHIPDFHEDARDLNSDPQACRSCILSTEAQFLFDDCSFVFTLKIYLFSFNVYEIFTCVYVAVLCVCLVPRKPEDSTESFGIGVK